MQLPFFYAPYVPSGEVAALLDEETSRHCVQVLRMEAGEQIHLTDGKGSLFLAEIVEPHKRSTQVRILSESLAPAPQPKVSIAISPLKNASRFEWFLEKATEIGISEIIPILCERTEKQHFRYDRMKKILVSAMLQSQQSWLPALPDLQSLAGCLAAAKHGRRFIAHCMDVQKVALRDLGDLQNDALVLIGPEGDFTPKEIELAVQYDCIPVSLGATRLRTETAGLVAATLLRI